MLPLLAIGFALGVYAASLTLPLYWILLFAPLFLWRRSSILLPLGALCGAFVLWLHQQSAPASLVAFSSDGPIEALIEGELIAGPSPAFAADGTERRRIDLRVTRRGPAPGTSGDWSPLDGGLRLTINAVPEGLALGDYVRVWASVSALSSPQNPNEVDARERIYGQGIDAIGFCKGLMVLGHSRASGIDWLRATVARSIDHNLSGEARAVMGALVLGEPGSLPPELRARFAATGTAHLLAVSGGHVVIVAMLIELLLKTFWLRAQGFARRFSPPRGIALVSFFFVVGYVYFVGASPSALRAGLAMGALLLCKALGRKIDGTTLVSLSALLALGIEPLELFGPSLQLSFAAVIGLGLFSPKLKKRLTFAWEETGDASLVWLWRSLRDLCVATLAATLATSPIVAWHFSQAAPASLLANLALVPLVSFLLLPLGLLGAFFAALSFSAGAALCFSLSSTLWGWLAALLYFVSPERPTTLPLGAPAVLCCYALLASLFFLLGWKQLIAALVSAACTIFAYWAPLENPPGLLRVTFFSIGQGDSIFIELPDGRNILIDGGGAATGHDDPGARSLMPFLRWRGVSQIDLMVLSHPHPDHFGGLATVSEELPVKRFWHNGGFAPDPRFQRLLAATKEVTSAPKDGESPYEDLVTQWGDVSLQILGPVYEGVARPHEDENDNSLVFKLVYQDRSILFTGDAEAIAEEAMLESKKDLHADVLKIGHHGSRSSTTDDFLEAVNPGSVVICLGKKNQYGFPHQEVSARLIERKLPTWRTDNGAVILETDGHDLTIRQSTPRTFAGEL